MNSLSSKTAVTEISGLEIYKFSTVLAPPGMDAAWKQFQRSRDRITLLKWFGLMVAVGGAVLCALSQVNW